MKVFDVGEAYSARGPSPAPRRLLVRLSAEHHGRVGRGDVLLDGRGNSWRVEEVRHGEVDEQAFYVQVCPMLRSQLPLEAGDELHVSLRAPVRNEVDAPRAAVGRFVRGGGDLR